MMSPTPPELKPQGGLRYILLVSALLGAVFIAGAATIVTAVRHGYTPIVGGPPRLPGH